MTSPSRDTAVPNASPGVHGIVDAVAAVVLVAVPAWLLGLFVGENFDLAPLIVIPIVAVAVVLLVGRWRLGGADRRGVVTWFALAIVLLVLAAIERIVDPDRDIVHETDTVANHPVLRDLAQLAAGAGLGVCLALLLAAANEAMFGRALGPRQVAVVAVAGAVGGTLGVVTYLFVGFF